MFCTEKQWNLAKCEPLGMDFILTSEIFRSLIHQNTAPKLRPYAKFKTSMDYLFQSVLNMPFMRLHLVSASTFLCLKFRQTGFNCLVKMAFLL